MDEEELPYGSAYLFNADAQAILEEAPDLEVGLELLTQAYGANSWDNPDKAKETAATYAQQLRYRFEDTTPYHADDVVGMAPIDMASIPLAEGGSLADQISNWESANISFLDTTKDPEYLTVREKLKTGIKDYASALRREESGKDQSWLSDKFYRASLGLTGGIAKLVGADDYVRGLQESTDPSRDDDLSSAIAGGAGTFAGAIGVGIVSSLTTTPVGGIAATSAYLAASGAGEVRETYEESLARTGDSNRALVAGAIETGSQALQTVVGGKIFGSTAKAVAGSILKGTATQAIKSATTLAAGRAASAGLATGAGRVAASAVAEGSAEAAGNVVSNYADKYGTLNPDIDIFDNTGTNFLVGAIFGAAAGGIEAIASRSGPQVLQGVNPVTGVNDPIESSVIGAPIDVGRTQEIQDQANATTDSAIDVPPTPQIVGNFKTEDGSTYSTTPEGATKRFKESSSEAFHPLDRTFFVEEPIAAKLAALRDAQTPDGSKVQILTDGEQLLIKSDFVNDDLTIADNPTGKRIIPIAATEDPASGNYPVEVNRPRNLNGNKLEYRSHIGRKITEVTPVPEAPPTSGGKSAGAAFTKERKLGMRLRLSDDISKSIQEGFGDAEGGYLRYMEKPNIETNNRAEKFIAERGMANSVEDFLSLDTDHASAESVEVARQLVRYYNNAVKKAEVEGDTAAVQNMSDTAIRIGEKAASILTNAGQTVQIAKLWQEFDPQMRVNAIRKKLNDDAIGKAATELDASVQEVREAPTKLAELDTQIEALTQEGARRAKPTKEGEIPNPEDGLNPAQKEKLGELRERRAKQEKLAGALTTKKQETLAQASPEKLDRIQKLVSAAQRVTGSDQLRLLREALKLEQEVLTNSKDSDALNSLYTYWQLNLLSDPSTQAVNVIGNSFQLAANALSFLATGAPRGKFDGLEFIKGAITGLTGEGFDAFVSEIQGKQTFKAGDIKLDTYGNVNTQGSTGRTDWVTDAPAIAKKFKLNNIGYVFRALSAMDAAFYRSNQEGIARLIAYNEAKKEGSSTESIRDSVANKLFNSQSNWDAAMRQAEADAKLLDEVGVTKTPREIKLRAWEILEQQRDPALRGEAETFASKSTFTNQPTGAVGKIVSAMGFVNNIGVNFRGVEIKPLKYVFPFMKVAGNILNANLDYTPVGLVRALNDPKSGDLTELERRNAAGKFMLGALGTGIVYGMAREFLDEEDPGFAIYGKGPSDPALLRQMRNSGWKPYSIKIGDRYIKYNETPLGLILGALGSYMDVERYNKAYAKQSGSAAIATILGGMGNSFVENSFLRNIADFVKVISGEEGVDLTNVLAINPLKGFIPAVGTLRALSKLIEDPIDTNNNFYAKMVSGVPFVQGVGTRPALNAFGEPVERTFQDRLSFIGRFYTQRTTDPAWRFLAENGYKISDPTTTIPTKGTQKAKDREVNLGAAFAGVMTPDEKYEFTERSGPLVKEKILEYSQRYGAQGYQEEVQERLSKEISAIRNRVKQDMFLR